MYWKGFIFSIFSVFLGESFEPEHIINSRPKREFSGISSQFYIEAFLDKNFKTFFFFSGLVNLQENSDGNNHSYADKSE